MRQNTLPAAVAAVEAAADIGFWGFKMRLIHAHERPHPAPFRAGLIFSQFSDKNLSHSSVHNKQKRYLDLIDRFAGLKVAVWGDYILDEYLYGHTRRISREAPVLILSHQATHFAMGGAGNSLLNIKSLNAIPLPVGVVGSDTAGRKIRAMVKKCGISADNLIESKEFATPVKTRVLAGEENTRKQQILRIDREGKVPESAGLKKEILANLKPLPAKVDALLISDYHYFTVKADIYQKILPWFQAKQLPVTLDSRFRLRDFPGNTVSTPNEPEAQAALLREMRSQPAWMRETGRLLLQHTAAQAVLLTRGSKGMVLYEKGRPMYSIPIHGSSDIVDVTGAGDTVISVLTLALAAGASFKEAADLANLAGGRAVMKKGTATLSPQELKKAVTG